MIKVVFQAKDYWLDERFWNEALASGLAPVLVELRNGVVTIRTIARDEFQARFSNRVAGWSVSAHKSVSVFAAGATAKNRAMAIRDFQDAIIEGLKAVLPQFTARTRAQGKVRLPGEAGFVVAVHVEAKNGSPQLHAHVAVDPRTRAPSTNNEYATDTRELYRQRKLLNSAVNQELASRLTRTFRARVSKASRVVWLPNVPRSLCRTGSVRSRQIDDFIARNGYKNTPRARKLAALATRTDNRDPRPGRGSFKEALFRSGFRSESICDQSPPNPGSHDCPKTVNELTARVGREARRLLQSVRNFTAEELLGRVLDRAGVPEPVEGLRTATSAVLREPHRFGLRVEVDARGKTRFASAQPLAQWKSVLERIDCIRVENETAKRPNGSGKQKLTIVPPPKDLPISATPVPKTPGAKITPPRTLDPLAPKIVPSLINLSQTAIRASRGSGACNAKKRGNQDASPDTESISRAEENSDWRRTMRHVFRSYRIVGAVGQMGIQLAAKAAELYSARRREIFEANGPGGKKTPGSVAALVRDLSKTPYLESHRIALRAMVRSNGTFEQKLKQGELAYRHARTPKVRILRQALIIIRDFEAANPRDVRFILRKAAAAGARVLLVEGQCSEALLERCEKMIRPGERHRLRGSEQKP